MGHTYIQKSLTNVAFSKADTLINMNEPHAKSSSRWPLSSCLLQTSPVLNSCLNSTLQCRHRLHISRHRWFTHSYSIKHLVSRCTSSEEAKRGYSGGGSNMGARGWADVIQLIVIKWHDRGEWLSATWQVGSLYLLAQGSVHSSVLTDSYSVPPLHPLATPWHTHTPWGRKTNLCTFPQSRSFPYKTLETEQITMYQTSVLLNYGKGHNTSYLIWAR